MSDFVDWEKAGSKGARLRLLHVMSPTAIAEYFDPLILDTKIPSIVWQV